MNRLTDKKFADCLKNGSYMTYNKTDDIELLRKIDSYSVEDCYRKLSEYENIGEEIGIDLITKDRVEKAETIYHHRNGEMKICGWFRTHIYLELNGCWSNYTLEYKDYGSTWALTKEELK